MKRIIVILILFCIIPSLFSQTKKSNYGYILLSNQDSVRGYFLNKAEFYNSESVEFIVAPNSNKTQSFKSSDIISGKSEKIEIASITVKSSVGFENIIAEKLIIGKYASLYKSYKYGEELFYIEKDTSIIELSTKYFIGIINVLLGDCDRLKSDYSENKYSDHKNYTYKESVFAQLIITYNKCKGKASDINVIKKSPFVNRSGVFVGITSNTISYNKTPYKDVDFNRHITPSLGVFLNTTYKDLISFESNLVYTYLKSSAKFTTPGTIMLNGTVYTTDIDAQLDYKIHLIQVPLALKLNVYKYSNFQAFIKGGISLDYAFSNKSVADIKPTLSFLTSVYKDEIPYSTLNYSLFWGAGINFNKKNNTLYFLDIGFYTSKTSSTPVTAYSWSIEEIEGTFNYFTIIVGKSF